MIKVSEVIKLEYSSKEESKEHAFLMIEKGFDLISHYSSIDFYGREHYYAEFKKTRKGYAGISVERNGKNVFN